MKSKSPPLDKTPESLQQNNHMNGFFDDITEVASENLAPILQDPANRGRSWDRCYAFFRHYHQWDKAERRKNMELACLHLGFYLASWGMFRGSGPLIHKDYTIYKGVIEKLLEEKYHALWQADYFQELLTGNVPIGDNNLQVKLIFRLANEIQRYFGNLNVIRNHHAEQEQANVSDTLITKILMGILCCTPAYDKYFKKGLTACDVQHCGSFSSSYFARLLNICRENNLWANLQRQPIKYYGVVYPVMRVVDLYFWTKGYNAERRG
jgi:hypothetical protein